MANTKISALTALTGAGVDSAADVLPIVDTSATTTKKITVAELLIGLAALPLAGGTLTGNTKTKTVTETLVTANSGTSYTVDLSTANVFEITLTGNVTFTFSNPAATGTAHSFTVKLIQDATGSRTVTWPASVKWAGGTAPTVTPTASKADVFSFITTDGGTKYDGFVNGQNYA